MRLLNTVCTCAVTLLLVLGDAVGQKDPSMPVAPQPRPADPRNALTPAATNGRHNGKRYGSSHHNDVRRYGPAPNAVNGNGYNGNHGGINEGHRIITRALWRIFDALMQKKDHAQLYGRVTFVEEALKKMISVDSQLEDEIDKLKDEAVSCRSQLAMVLEEVSRVKGLEGRITTLENDHLALQQQGDQQHGAGWGAAPAYSSCPTPFEVMDGECFYLAADEMLGWDDARRECGRLGGDLASPRNIHSLRSYLGTVPDPPEYLWVGASKQVGSTWVWTSGTQAGVPVDMSKDTWNEEVPSGSGRCMGLFGQSSYRAYNYDCKEKDYFVCQYYF